MLVHLALLTLLTLFVVHLPLWTVAVLAVVTSPFITWTYTLLMDVAAQADAWTAVQLPFPGNHGVNHESAQLIWVVCLGIVLVRLYDNQQAKLAIPWYSPCWRSPSTAPSTLHGWAPAARRCY